MTICGDDAPHIRQFGEDLRVWLHEEDGRADMRSEGGHREESGEGADEESTDGLHRRHLIGQQHADGLSPVNQEHDAWNKREA